MGAEPGTSVGKVLLIPPNPPEPWQPWGGSSRAGGPEGDTELLDQVLGSVSFTSPLFLLTCHFQPVCKYRSEAPPATARGAPCRKGFPAKKVVPFFVLSLSVLRQTFSFIDGENSETDSHLSAPPAEVAFYKMRDRNQSCSPDSSSHAGGMVPAGFQESQQFSLLQGSLGAQFAGLSIINVRRDKSSGGFRTNPLCSSA